MAAGCPAADHYPARTVYESLGRYPAETPAVVPDGAGNEIRTKKTICENMMIAALGKVSVGKMGAAVRSRKPDPRRRVRYR